MNFKETVKRLESLRDQNAIEGMTRFGITPGHAYGVSLPELRAIAKKAGRDHALALKLWAKDSRETRILASMIEEPEKISEAQMDAWAKEFTYWEICDQACMNLFWLTPHAYRKAVAWSKRKEEYVKRTGFALMAVLAWKDKKADDKKLETFFPHIKKAATDDRTMVKKAVNWALRQIGKRNPTLNKKAVATAKEIQKKESKSAKWIAEDALRELEGVAVQARFRRNS